MNEEPIELEFIINSPELLEQASQVQKGLEGIDNTVLRAENNFRDYINTQLEASNAMALNVKLTKEQQRAYDTYTNSISGLKEMMQSATDPTQISVYEFKIKELTQSLENLISKANEKESLTIDTVKLEEAGRLIDSISDKTFTPSFASSEELELLSDRINKVDNEFEQLEIVIDFVNARLNSLGDNDTLLSIQDDINSANQLLGRNIEKYDATGNSISQMTDALIVFKDQLSTETDAKNIVTLNRNIEDLENRIKQFNSAGKTGFDELGNAITTEAVESVKGLKGQLADLVQQMANLRIQGKENTSQYRELSAEAKQLAGALSTVNEEVRFSASASSNLDTLIRATKGIASGYALAQSASALFGSEQKNLELTLVKITSTLSLLQGLQTIQLELARKDSIATKTLTYLKGLYAKAVGESTGALKGFKVALLASGIGVAIVLIGELIANWDKISKSIGLSSDELVRNQEIGKKANQMYGDKIAKLQLLAKTNEQVALSDQDKKKAVNDYNSEFGSTLGSVKDYVELENKIISNVGDYVEYLNVKSQAEASYMISLEKQKKLLEQIMALSTGDLTWYEKLQDMSNKGFESIWKGLGIDIGETKRDISEREILGIIGLPTEAEFLVAISSYSNVIQDNLKDFRKQQVSDNGMLEASFDLQKKASELAEKYKVKPDDKNLDKVNTKAFEDKIKALSAIQNAEDTLAKNRLNGLQKTLLEIEQRYSKLRDEAIKAKLELKDLERIDSLEQQEVSIVKYASDTDSLKKMLEEAKKDYESYESYKAKTSESYAKETYSHLINTQQEYLDLLNSELDKINVKDMSEEQKSRYAMLTQMLIEYTDNKAEIEREGYAELYNLTATTEQQILAIKEKYAKMNLGIQAKYSGDELKQRQGSLSKEMRKEFDALATDLLNNSGDYSRALDIISTATRSQIERQIKELTKFLEVNKNISKEQRQAVNEIITDLTNKLPFAQNGRSIGSGATAIIDSQLEQTRARINQLNDDKKALTDKNGDAIKEFVKNVAEIDVEIGLLEKRLASLSLDRIGAIGQDLGFIGDQFINISNGLSGINPEMSQLFGILGEGLRIVELVSKTVSDLGKGMKDSGAAGGNSTMEAVGAGLEAAGAIAQIWGGIVAQQKKAYQEFRKWQMDVYRGELEYQALLRQRRFDSINRSGFEASNYQKELDELQKQIPEIEKQINEQLENLQNNGSYIVDRWRSKSFWRSTTKTTWGDLMGLDFDDLEKLYSENKLEGDTLVWFEELKKLKEELKDVQGAIEETQQAYYEAMTGSTVNGIADTIRKGVLEGKKDFEDFSEDIEEMLRNAILQGMLTDSMAEGIKELQKEMAEMMEDGELSETDADKIREMYMDIVNDAQKTLDALNKTGIDFTTPGSESSNSLKGAIKGMTENQADLLAGQMGGWRLAQLETNSILNKGFMSHLEVLSKQVELQMKIEINTRATAVNTDRTAKAVETLITIKPKNKDGILKSAGIWTP